MVATSAFAVAALLTTLGYLVRFRQHAFLLAGYRDEEVTDKPGLCKTAGNMLFVIALWWTLMAVALLSSPGIPVGGVVAAIVVLTLATVVVGIARARRHLRDLG